MTEPLLRTMPPSDLQIATVERICRERGFPMPPLHSSTEASQIISALVAREYHPPEWDDDETSF